MIDDTFKEFCDEMDEFLTSFSISCFSLREIVTSDQYLDTGFSSFNRRVEIRNKSALHLYFTMISLRVQREWFGLNH